MNVQGNRWKLHGLACFTLFVNYYLYDIPGAMYRPLKDHLQGLGNSQTKGTENHSDNNSTYWKTVILEEDFPFYMSLLYSLYSISNVILPLLSGWIMDRGHRKDFKKRSSLLASRQGEETGLLPCDNSKTMDVDEKMQIPKQIPMQSPMQSPMKNTIPGGSLQERHRTLNIQSELEMCNNSSRFTLTEPQEGRKIPWLMIFSTLTLIGQIFYFAGIYYRSFTMLAIGRFIFGLGGESVGVATTRAISVWFRGHEMALALGIYLSVGRLGTVTNNLITPYVSIHKSVLAASSVGLFLGVLSIFAASSIQSMLANEECIGDDAPSILESIEDGVQTTEDGAEKLIVNGGNDFDDTLLPQKRTMNRAAALSNASTIDFELREINDTIPTTNMGAPNISSVIGKDDSKQPTSVALVWGYVIGEVSSLVQQVHSGFLWICGASFLLYGIMVPFSTVASDFLQQPGLGYTSVQAGYVMSIPDAMALFMVPFLGRFVDEQGGTLRLLLSSAFLSTLAHINLAMGHPALPSFFMLGLAYSGIFTIWTTVPRLVPSHLLTTAYGIVTASCNLGFTMIPMLSAMVLAFTHKNYRQSEVLLAILSAAGFACILKLAIENVRDNLGLDDTLSGSGTTAAPSNLSTSTITTNIYVNNNIQSDTIMAKNKFSDSSLNDDPSQRQLLPASSIDPSSRFIYRKK